MATEDKYVSANLAAGKLETAAFSVGDKTVTGIAVAAIAAADAISSIYRLFKNLNPNLVPLDIKVINDAITGLNDADLGLYRPLEEGGAVDDIDCFADGMDLSTAHAVGSELSGFSAVSLSSHQKHLYEHAGHTLAATIKTGYDLALTAKAEPTGAGTVIVKAIFVQG